MSITWPPGDWVPNPNQLGDSAAVLLAVSGGALDRFGRGEEYHRRTWTHGDTVWEPSGGKQLIVSLDTVHTGRAGQQQYQFDSGNFGVLDFLTAVYSVEVVNPWPTVTGGIAPQLADDPDTMQASLDLWTDAWLVFSALRALGLGGSVTDPPVVPIPKDGVLVSPMAPTGPRGTLAGYKTGVSLQIQ